MLHNHQSYEISFFFDVIVMVNKVGWPADIGLQNYFVIYLYNIVKNIQLKCLCLYTFMNMRKLIRYREKIEISIAMLSLIGLYTTCENEFG